MIDILAKYTPSASPASSTEEAEERLLELLKQFAETPLRPRPKGEGRAAAGFTGHLNIWHRAVQYGLALAYREIAGKPAPDELQVDFEKNLFPQP